jgi:hypothetical protein
VNKSPNVFITVNSITFDLSSIYYFQLCFVLISSQCLCCHDFLGPLSSEWLNSVLYCFAFEFMIFAVTPLDTLHAF